MTKELNIDKSDWKPVKLGDVVVEGRDRMTDIITDGIEHVVGLEHIDSENIHLSRSANTENSTTFTKKFQEGDVLFGRRRAYLKKAAQASFGGICSGDITILRVKKIDSSKLSFEKDKIGELLPELLPFVINNDKFFDYAIKHSAGGLSPRVKFRDLANYEFLLPPKEQQTQLAELLWATDELVENENEILERLNIAFNSNIEKEIHGLEIHGQTVQNVLSQISKTKKLKFLDSLGDFFKGKGIPKSALVEEGMPCIRYGELYTKHNRVIRNYYSFIDSDSTGQGLELRKDDVLFAGSGETITEIGKSAAFITNDKVFAGSDIIVFRPKNMDGTFLGYLMNSQLVRQQLNKRGTGATVMHIYSSDLKKVLIPFFNLKEQIQIGKRLEEFSKNIKKLEEKIIVSKSLQKSLINQIF